MIKGTQVKLTESEMRVARWISKSKYENCRKENVRESSMDSNKTEMEVSDEGYLGEFAFCKLFNLWPDLTVDNKSKKRGTDTGDLILPNGKTVDVKSTPYLSGKLIERPWARIHSDYYALMTGKDDTFIFRGFIESSKVICPQSRLENFYGKPAYVVEQGLLKNLNEL